MNEEENASVTEEQSLGAATPAIDAESSQSERTESQATQRKRNDVEYNWAEARRKKQELEQHNQDLLEEINRLKTAKTPQEEDDIGIKDDDLAEGKHLRALKKEIKNLRSDLEKNRAVTMEDRLQLKFPDYNDVLTPENIEILKQQEPELAMSISHIPDPYNQAVAAYKLLKKIGVKQDDSMPLEKKKAIENSQKPLSVQAISKGSPLENVNAFANMSSLDKKSFLRKTYEEMQAAIKGG